MIFPHAIWTNPYAVSEAILRSKGKIIVDISKHMSCHSWLESGHDGRWAWWSSMFRHKHPLCPDLWLTLDLFWGRLCKVYASVPLNFFSLTFRSSWNRRKYWGGVCRRPAFADAALKLEGKDREKERKKLKLFANAWFNWRTQRNKNAHIKSQTR